MYVIFISSINTNTPTGIIIIMKIDYYKGIVKNNQNKYKNYKINLKFPYFKRIIQQFVYNKNYKYSIRPLKTRG